MEMNSTNLKNWLKNLGFETDGKIDDNVLNKLIPPQRRDMWRHIVNHVLPEKDVDLIKKSIMLHKLHERQKPLMAKVESEVDLVNALKYEKLKENYKKIQKNIAEVKIKNNKIKTDFNEKNECKKNLIKNIELKQNSMYLVKHNIEFYSKLIEILSEKSDVCHHFSTEANRSLTKTDYEDLLIKCLVEIDQAKQSGVMNDGLNIGQKLCNDVYKSIKDKSPKIYIQTIENNLSNHLNKCNKIITEEIKINDSNNYQENDFKELLAELFQKQLELKSKLSSLVTKKDCVIKQLKDTATKEKKEIISQYQLKYISNTNQELLLAFEKNLNEAFQNIITNSINNSNIIGFQDAVTLEKDKFKTLDSILEKTNILNEEIDQKKNIAFEMLKEFNDKNSDFGLSSVKSAIDQITGNYLEKNICNQINEKILCLKDCISSVDDDFNKTTISTTPKSSVLNFRTWHDIKHLTKMIDVISKLNIKFEQLYKTLPEEKNFDDIAQKENRHKSEFISLMDQMETNILDLGSTIEDCKLVSDVLSSLPLKDLLSFENS